MLRYSEAITLNIEYIKLTQENQSRDDAIDEVVVSSLEPSGSDELK